MTVYYNNNIKPEKPITADIVNNKLIELRFYHSKKFSDITDKVKLIPKRKKDMKENGVWIVPLTLDAIEDIENIGFVLSPELKKWKKIDSIKDKSRKKKSSPEVVAKNVNLEDILYPFQKEGLSFLEQKKGRALIGDEMGLGKTLQAIAYLKLYTEDYPVVIIVPATLKINWQRELKKWIDRDSYIVNGTKDEVYFEEKTIIINYDIVGKHLNNLKKLKPKIIILDESHRIKNPQAKRTKAIINLCRKTDKIIALTGTAILNRPIEIFTTLNILCPDVYDNYYRFGHRYCDPKHNGFGNTFNGATNMEELHGVLKKYIMIRRKKMDVLKELPEKHKSTTILPIDNREEYNRAETDIIAYIREQDGKEKALRASRAEMLVKFNVLKRLAIAGKMTSIIKWIDNFFLTNDKLVLFGVHKKTIADIQEHYADSCVKIDGSVGQSKRQRAVDSFQNDPKIKLFIGNIQAASEGITLTAAHHVAFCELGWTPGLHTQAEDRIHRIGQDNMCMIHYLLAENTVEEEIAEKIDAKQKIISKILDGEEADRESLLTEMIQKYREKGV